MTDITEQRVKEAVRRAFADDPTPRVEDVARIAIQLEREGWEPEDEDLVLAREVCARNCYLYASPAEVLAGHRDSFFQVQLALAAIKAGREAERRKA